MVARSEGQVIVRDSVDVSVDTLSQILKINTQATIYPYASDWRAFPPSAIYISDHRYGIPIGDGSYNYFTFGDGVVQFSSIIRSYIAPLFGLHSHQGSNISVKADINPEDFGCILVLYHLTPARLNVSYADFKLSQYGGRYEYCQIGDEVFMALLDNNWSGGYATSSIKAVAPYEYEVRFFDFPFTIWINGIYTGMPTYEVVADKDTVAFQDTTAVNVIAWCEDSLDPAIITDGTRLDFSIFKGERYGSYLTVDGTEVKSLTDVKYEDVRLGHIRFVVNGEMPQTESFIILKVENTGVEYPSGMGILTVLPSTIQYVLSFQADPIRYSEITSLHMQALLLGKPTEPPEGTKFFLAIDTIGQQYGRIILNDSTIVQPDVSISYEDLSVGNVKYHANGTKSDSPVIVKITATHSSDPSIAVFEVLNILPPLDHFQVSVIPDTVKHENQAVIMVKAKDKNNNDIDLSSSAFVSFALDTAGIVYGELQYDDNKAKMFNSIPYPEAATGKIKYLADGKNPLNLYPRLINIPVTSMQDASVSGIGKGWVQAFVDVEKYSQGNPDYSGDIYGNSKDSTIQQLGCALCCMAMVMRAYGDSVDPGDLNEWMKDSKRNGNVRNGGYDGNRVSWFAVELHSNNEIDMEPGGKRINIKKDPVTKEKKPDLGNASNLAVLDEPLLKGQLIIVQVFNNETKGQHFVVVTEKVGGRYRIVDPGYRNVEYLDQYGEFWRYYIVKKNQ